MTSGEAGTPNACRGDCTSRPFPCHVQNTCGARRTRRRALSAAALTASGGELVDRVVGVATEAFRLEHHRRPFERGLEGLGAMLVLGVGRLVAQP